MYSSTPPPETIIETITYETNHLLGTLNHSGSGLNVYAARYDVRLLVNKIDNTAPTLQLNTSGNKVSAVAADKQSGLAAFEYSLNGADFVATANHKAISFKNGDTVTYRATDNAGNVTEKRYDYNAIDYNALKNYDTLSASSELSGNLENDIIKGLIA